MQIYPGKANSVAASPSDSAQRSTLQQGRRQPIIRGIASALFVLFAAQVASPACAQTGEQSDPAERLAEKGLVRAGLVWVTPVEAQLRELLAIVRKQDAELRGTVRKFDQALTTNNNKLALVNQARAESDELGRRIDTGAANGTLSVAQINQLTVQHNQRAEFINSVGPGLFDAKSKVNNLPLAQLQQQRIELRNSLIEKLLEIDRIAGQIEASYATFAADEQVLAALEELGKNNRLGPAKVYEADLKRLPRTRLAVLTGDNPLNREGEDYRLWGIVNEKQGRPFTFNPDCEFHFLAAADALELDLDIPNEAAEESLRYSDSRQVMGNKVTLPSLRLGDQLFLDTTFYILGEKDVDLGSVLGGKAFGDAKLDFQPQMLMLKISGADAPEPEPEDK